jgi:RNA polymerase sigma-70 factor (ECF subfamily)
LPPEAVPYARELRVFRAIDGEGADVVDRESLELVARFQQGDHDAFEALYRRHYAATYNYLRISLRDAHQAEDITQQVFLRALQSLAKYEFRPNIPFRSWLNTIARNELVRAIHRSGPTVEPRDPSDLDRTAGSPTDWLSERELMALAEHLPPREQQVFVLRHGIGLSTRETGLVMDVSQDAVRSLGKRALARLRQKAPELGYIAPELPDQRLPMRRRPRPSPVLAQRRAALAAWSRRLALAPTR